MNKIRSNGSEARVSNRRFSDSCKTDITMGNLCGLRTLAVLTGISTRQDLERLVETAAGSAADGDLALQVPELMLPQIGDLLPFL